MLLMLALFLFDIFLVKYCFAALIVKGDIRINAAESFFQMPGRIVRAKICGIEERFQLVLHMIEQRNCARGISRGYNALLLPCLLHAQRSNPGVKDAPLSAV